MPSARSRNIDDTHPVARYLFQAADLGSAQSLTLSYANNADASRAAVMLRGFRNRRAIAAPGTFEITTLDPKGEGRGMFDHIEIRLKGNKVVLGLRAPPTMPAPKNVEITE